MCLSILNLFIIVITRLTYEMSYINNIHTIVFCNDSVTLLQIESWLNWIFGFLYKHIDKSEEFKI